MIANGYIGHDEYVLKLGFVISAQLWIFQGSIELYNLSEYYGVSQ